MDITIEATQECNRGCRHCLSDALPGKGNHFRPDDGRIILDHIDELFEDYPEIAKPVGVCITGGGEPLLNPFLPELVEVFGKSSLVGELVVVTSGAFAQESEFGDLQRIIDLGIGQKLNFFLSYSKYNDTFDSRLRSMLQYLIKEDVGIGIKVTYSYDNFKRTFYDLQKILSEFGIEPLVIMDKGFRSDDIFHHFDESDLHYLNYLSLSVKGWYRDKSSDRKLEVNFQHVLPNGRGRQLKERMHKRYKCCFFENSDMDTLYFSTDGMVYPCCGSFSKSLAIGRIGDNQFTMIKKACIMSRILGTERLAYPYGRDVDICEVCNRLADIYFADGKIFEELLG